MKQWLCVLLSGLVINLQAQGLASEIIKGGAADAKVFLNAYLEPLFKGFASANTAGWYNSAKPLGKLGIHVSVSGSAFNVPESDQSYLFKNLSLENSVYSYSPAPGNSPERPLPTVFGSNTEPSANYDVYYRLNSVDSLVYLCRMQLPDGLNLPLAPAIPPVLQLNLGLFQQSELMIRYFPAIRIQNFTSTQYGLGLKHSIKQWLPGVKKVPFWDWSVMGCFSWFKQEFQVAEANRLKASIYPNAVNFNAFKNELYPDQAYALEGNSINIGTVASLKLGPFTPYCGLSYTRSRSGFEMKGRYPILTAVDDLQSPDFGKPFIKEVENPVGISGMVDGFRLTGGLRLKLGYLLLHYDYSINSYGYYLHSAGIGFHVQELIPM